MSTHIIKNNGSKIETTASGMEIWHYNGLLWAIHPKADTAFLWGANIAA